MFNWFDELKANVEGEIKTAITSGVKSITEAFTSGLQDWLQLPEPAEPFQKIRSFYPTTTRLITQDGVSVENDSWKIESHNQKSVVLFEMTAPSMQECLLLCQCLVKTAYLYEPAQLTLSVQNSAWNFSRSTSVSGTTNWHLWQVPFHYKKEQSSGLVRISIEFSSGGILWVKDLEILQAAVKPTSR